MKKAGLKRLFDFTAALCGLVVLSPFFILVGLLIKIYDRGPVLFAQQRVGRGGRAFTMLKFRSMAVDAPQRGPQITVGADRRITPVGKFLRQTKLDELPQLLNVLRGQMSLVGPRPEVQVFVSHYTPAQREVLLLQPGVTDPASFAFYHESELLGQSTDPERFYRDHLLGEKIRINMEYATRANFLTDLILILATVARPLGIEVDIFALFKMQPPATQAPLV